MRALLIPVEGPPEVVEQSGLEDLQKHVGGWVEGLDCCLPGCYAWGNEDAKHISRYVETEDDHGKWVEGLPLNPLASALVYGEAPLLSRKRMSEEMMKVENDGFFVVDARGPDPREPFVAGPLLITGNDRHGATQPIGDVALAIVNDIQSAMKGGVVAQASAREFALTVGAYEELR